MSDSSRRPALVFLKRPLTQAEIESVEARGFELPMPQMPVLDAQLAEADLSWFGQQPFVGKISLLPRNDAELRAMAAGLEAEPLVV